MKGDPQMVISVHADNQKHLLKRLAMMTVFPRLIDGCRHNRLKAKPGLMQVGLRI